MGVREIARKAGISSSHASRVLSGKRRPSLRVAARIAKAKEMTLDKFYREFRETDGPRAA